MFLAGGVCSCLETSLRWDETLFGESSSYWEESGLVGVWNIFDDDCCCTVAGGSLKIYFWPADYKVFMGLGSKLIDFWVLFLEWKTFVC